MSTFNRNRHDTQSTKSLGRKTLFKRACKAPACPRFARPEGQYCEEHKHLEHSTDRLTAHQRGYTSRWNKERKLHLMNHPWCEHCKQEGTLTPATEVDHIIPHQGYYDLFWDYDNWQSLCKSCHSRKTQYEDREKWY